MYTVGFYDNNGKWVAESDHDTTDSAARRVTELNGGAPPAKTQHTGPSQAECYLAAYMTLKECIKVVIVNLETVNAMQLTHAEKAGALKVDINRMKRATMLATDYAAGLNDNDNIPF